MKKIKTETTMEMEVIDNGTLPCDIIEKLEFIKKNSYLMSRLDKPVLDVLDECEKEIKKSRSRKPSITSFEDAKHLMLEKFGRNYTYYCFFERKEPSRGILEFWNGFLCALEITEIITPDDAKKIFLEISGK